MDSQETLDKWINSCLNYYNLKSNIKMKTTEERFQQLELAHARLFNQYQNLSKDFENLTEQLDDRFSELKSFIVASSIQKDEAPALPDKLQNNVEYKGVITEVVTSTPTKWKDMEYTNWEVRLEGKETYVMVAFIPTEYKLAAGDKVRFTYAHPFQLRKLKQI